MNGYLIHWNRVWTFTELSDRYSSHNPASNHEMTIGDSGVGETGYMQSQVASPCASQPHVGCIRVGHRSV